MATPFRLPGGSLKSKMTVTVVGQKDVERLIRRSFIGDLKTQKKVFLKALWVGSQPIVKRARSEYKAFGQSGSLAYSMRAYRWKNNTDLGHEIRVGPKRSIRSALFRWILHYKRRVTPRTFNYGIRHGHLIEFGFDHKQAKRRIPGHFIIEHAGNLYGRRVGPIVREQVTNVIRKETERIMRRRTRTRLR